MVIDTSALLAILFNEPERRRFTEALEAADARALSVVSFVEASLVVEVRVGAAGTRLLDELIERANVELIPVDVAQSKEARAAFTRFGKGRHAAALNFGDCFSYALARTRDEPLLFKGNDFAHTDVRAAAPER